LLKCEYEPMESISTRFFELNMNAQNMPIMKQISCPASSGIGIH
jgi:hypothetical protein